MPKSYPVEFREGVIRVARLREPGVTIDQIARDFGSTRSRFINGYVARRSKMDTFLTRCAAA